MTEPRRFDSLVWAGLLVFTLVCLALRDQAAWLVSYPTEWVIPITGFLDGLMDRFVERSSWFFNAVSAGLDWPMRGVRAVLHSLPWPVILTVLTFVAYAASGWKLALFSFLSLLYMVVVGYWAESMSSLALVVMSVPLAVLLGFAVGTLGYFSYGAQRVIVLILDLLQTIPAFAYLLPILLLFGFGPVVGLIASVLFAFPPMVRNTMLGLAGVSPEVIESGLMSGAKPSQLFWQVRVPSALKQILLGVNQATMAAFSMVIVASIIGGTSDIGWEVLQAMRKAQFGESLLAGIVIALMAMMMDRTSAAFALAEKAESSAGDSFLARHRYLVLAGVSSLVLIAAAQFVPFLKSYPQSWEFYPAELLNDGVNYIIVEYAGLIGLIKSLSFFYLMLPLKIGLEQTISPFSWGFEFTATRKTIYALLAVALTLAALYRLGTRAAITAAFLLIVVFFGLTKLPWPALICMAAYLGWQLGGIRLALTTVLGLLFLLLAGVWTPAMLSIYLCGIAVVLSFVIGSGIGILAAEFDSVSRFVRPINDTLQTMPLFVILIPFVMVFKIGEFTALLAVMAYAVVPAIRYAEHGLRNVSNDVIEPARAMGCTPWQLLWQVKMPLALPVLMLGLNQTIMYGIAMLVIAALVGTDGLGQQVYIGLGDGDFGVGMVAGIGMAIIAIVADRMTQAWSKSRREAFGMD